MGWSARPRMPLWATPDAVAAARRLLREAAEQTPPLDPDRVQHLVLESAVLSGTAIRQMNAVLAPSGVTWEMPFLDDRVLEAALSVRIADRFARDRYKPVLAEAVRGIVPEPVLGRRSKGEYSAEVYDGMRRNQHDLLAYCDDLRLGERGLADPVALRSALVGPKPESRHLAPFENTLACEAWLRRVTSTAGKEIPV
jgi:asparagine synthase (glutamine-hydrolysing)